MNIKNKESFQIYFIFFPLYCTITSTLNDVDQVLYRLTPVRVDYEHSLAPWAGTHLKVYNSSTTLYFTQQLSISQSCN